jgi:hypothetical protein
MRQVCVSPSFLIEHDSFANPPLWFNEAGGHWTNGSSLSSD